MSEDEGGRETKKEMGGWSERVSAVSRYSIKREQYVGKKEVNQYVIRGVMSSQWAEPEHMKCSK